MLLDKLLSYTLDDYAERCPGAPNLCRNYVIKNRSNSEFCLVIHPKPGDLIIEVLASIIHAAEGNLENIYETDAGGIYKKLGDDGSEEVKYRLLHPKNFREMLNFIDHKLPKNISIIGTSVISRNIGGKKISPRIKYLPYEFDTLIGRGRDFFAGFAMAATFFSLVCFIY